MRPAQDLLKMEGLDCIVCGPGLGQTQAALHALAALLGHAAPLVVDADALNLIAADAKAQRALATRGGATLLHAPPAEAAGCWANPFRTFKAIGLPPQVNWQRSSSALPCSRATAASARCKTVTVREYHRESGNGHSGNGRRADRHDRGARGAGCGTWNGAARCRAPARTRCRSTGERGIGPLGMTASK